MTAQALCFQMFECPKVWVTGFAKEPGAQMRCSKVDATIMHGLSSNNVQNTILTSVLIYNREPIDSRLRGNDPVLW